MSVLKKLLVSTSVSMLVLTLCSGLTYAAEQGTITGKRVNIRESAGTDAKVLVTIEKGTRVSVIQKSGDWSKVKYNGKTGWICSDFISVTKTSSRSSTTKTTSASEKGTVTAETLNLRSKASLSASVVTKISEGSSVTILSKSGDWYKVKTSSGKIGWAYSDYISLKKASASRSTQRTVSRGGEVDRSEREESSSQKEQSSSTAEKIVDYAKKYIGIKYVYGGDSPKEGFDCSGFTKYVYSNFGISLERTSVDQASQGKHVDKSDLKVGDLVFFDTNGGHNRINHVGIYIGSGKFIHASSPRYDVTITSLSDDYYARSYMTARRILN